jgi:succinoglycan biosynthesis transport protein ExoP
MLWVLRNDIASDKTPHGGQTGPVGERFDVAPRISEPSIAPNRHLHEFIGLLRRRRTLILGLAIGGTMLAGVVGLLIPPKYTARAQIFVAGQGGDNPLADDRIIDTHVTMLSSRNHLQHVLTVLSEEAEAHDSNRGAANGAHATEPVGHDNASPAAPSGAAETTASDAGLFSLAQLEQRLMIWFRAFPRRIHRSGLGLDDLERNLKVLQERRSRVITVSFTSTSPTRAASIVNHIVQVYVDRQSEQQSAYLSVELERIGERIAALNNQIENAGSRLGTSIQRETGAAQSANGEHPNPEQGVRELQRKMIDISELQAGLLRRQKEIRQQQEVVSPGVSVASFASPPDRPSSANPILFMLPALVFSGIFGTLLAVFLERLDRSMRSERDIHDALGIPCVGLVPRGSQSRPYQHMLDGSALPYGEAIRSIATTLQLGQLHRASNLILVSSSLPGEGKTTFALSLAVSIATLKQRVLVVDFDFRRPPAKNQIDGSRDTGRGVSDLLLGNGSPSEFIRSFHGLGIDWLSTGRLRSDAIGILAGEGLPRLLQQLRQNYDYIIIDGPPLLGVTDARFLMPLVDKVLFLVKWGSTKREVAQNALNLLLMSKCFDKESGDFVGVVVTQVDLKKHARYGYGDFAESLAKYQHSDLRSIVTGRYQQAAAAARRLSLAIKRL